MIHRTYNQGFIQIMIIMLFLVIILSLLGVSLTALFGNPILQENFSFIKNGIKWIWNNYLSVPFWYIYEIFVELIWKPSLATLRDIKDGRITPADVFKPQ